MEGKDGYAASFQDKIIILLIKHKWKLKKNKNKYVSRVIRAQKKVHTTKGNCRLRRVEATTPKVDGRKLKDRIMQGYLACAVI